MSQNEMRRLISLVENNTRYNFEVYDNGGETADRYTIFWDDSGDYFAMDDSPTHPQGFSQFGSGAQKGEHLGKRIEFSSLPHNVQQHVMDRLKDSEIDLGDEQVEEAGDDMAVSQMGGSSKSLEDRIQNEAETTIECLPEDMPVRGNAMASGDPEIDMAAEDEIISNLEHNQWAWCTVKVTSTWNGLTADEYLGGCSYESEEDFVENSGYYQDMRSTTLSDIKDQAEKIISSGGTLEDSVQEDRTSGGEERIPVGDLVSNSGGNYRAVLILNGFDEKPVVQVEQQREDGSWRETPGEWYLDTLLDNPHDGISIDWGQNWSIESGMLSALKNAKKIADEAGADVEPGRIDMRAHLESRKPKNAILEGVMLAEYGGDYVEYHSQRNGEKPFVHNGSKYEYVNAVYPDGKVDIGVYSQRGDVCYSYKYFQKVILGNN